MRTSRIRCCKETLNLRRMIGRSLESVAVAVASFFSESSHNGEYHTLVGYITTFIMGSNIFVLSYNNIFIRL